MHEVVQLQLQICSLVATLALLLELLLRFAYQGQVAISVEVIIRLQEHDIVTTLGTLMVEVHDCLEVLLLKVLLLQFELDLLTLFQLTVSL